MILTQPKKLLNSLNFNVHTWFKGMMSNVVLDPQLDPNGPSDLLCDSVYITSKSCRYAENNITLMEDMEFVCVVSVGAQLLYVIPGFDALGIDIQHIIVKGFMKIGTSEDIFNLFI